jgi:hypothetical protein
VAPLTDTRITQALQTYLEWVEPSQSRMIAADHLLENLKWSKICWSRTDGWNARRYDKPSVLKVIRSTLPLWPVA